MRQEDQITTRKFHILVFSVILICCIIQTASAFQASCYGYNYGPLYTTVNNANSACSAINSIGNDDYSAPPFSDGNDDIAVSIASTPFSPSEIVNIKTQLASLPGDGNEQRLVWIVDIVSMPKGYIHQGGEVLVDVHTGKVLTVNPMS